MCARRDDTPSRRTHSRGTARGMRRGNASTCRRCRIRGRRCRGFQPDGHADSGPHGKSMPVQLVDGGACAVTGQAVGRARDASRALRYGTPSTSQTTPVRTHSRIRARGADGALQVCCPPVAPRGAWARVPLAVGTTRIEVARVRAVRALRGPFAITRTAAIWIRISEVRLRWRPAAGAVLDHRQRLPCIAVPRAEARGRASSRAVVQPKPRSRRRDHVTPWLG
jgi:hypothetical protein